MSSSYHLYVGPFVRILHKPGDLPDFAGAFVDRDLDEDAFSMMHNAEVPEGETWLVVANRERYVQRFSDEDVGWLIGDSITIDHNKLDFKVDYASYLHALRIAFGDDKVKVEWGVLAYYS